MRRHRHDYEFDGEDPYVVIERSGSGIGPLLLGLALGAGAALLFAPRSGADTRQLIKDRTREATDAARAHVDGLAESVAESIGEARSVMEERVGAIRSTVRRRRDDLRDAVDIGRSAAHEARTELEQKLAARKVAERQSRGRQHATPVAPDDIA